MVLNNESLQRKNLKKNIRYVASDIISSRIVVFLHWVRLGLHNGGQALWLGRLWGRALPLEQARGPSTVARVG